MATSSLGLNILCQVRPTSVEEKQTGCRIFVFFLSLCCFCATRQRFLKTQPKQRVFVRGHCQQSADFDIKLLARLKVVSLLGRLFLISAHLAITKLPLVAAIIEQIAPLCCFMATTKKRMIRPSGSRSSDNPTRSILMAVANCIYAEFNSAIGCCALHPKEHSFSSK